MNSIPNSFQTGFKIAVKSIDLLCVSLFFSLLAYQSKYLPSIVSIALLFLSSGFLLSLPLFLQKRHWKSRLNYSQIVSKTLENTRKIVWPTLSLFLCVLVFCVVGFIFSSIFFHEATLKFFQSVKVQPEFKVVTTIVLSLLVDLIISLFYYTQFFFALGQLPLILSFRRSVDFALHNWLFTLSLFFIETLFILEVFFETQESSTVKLLVILFRSTVNFYLTCSAYVYFQEHSQETRNR